MPKLKIYFRNGGKEKYGICTGDKSCGYGREPEKWLLRVPNPKSCPRCKRRFDYPKKQTQEEEGE